MCIFLKKNSTKIWRGEACVGDDSTTLSSRTTSPSDDQDIRLPIPTLIDGVTHFIDVWQHDKSRLHFEGSTARGAARGWAGGAVV